MVFNTEDLVLIKVLR